MFFPSFCRLIFFSLSSADVFIHSSQHLWVKPPVILLSYQSAHNFTRIHTHKSAKHVGIITKCGASDTPFPSLSLLSPLLFPLSIDSSLGTLTQSLIMKFDNRAEESERRGEWFHFQSILSGAVFFHIAILPIRRCLIALIQPREGSAFPSNENHLLVAVVFSLLLLLRMESFIFPLFFLLSIVLPFPYLSVLINSPQRALCQRQIHWVTQPARSNTFLLTIPRFPELFAANFSHSLIHGCTDLSSLPILHKTAWMMSETSPSPR